MDLRMGVGGMGNKGGTSLAVRDQVSTGDCQYGNHSWQVQNGCPGAGRSRAPHQDQGVAGPGQSLPAHCRG